MAGRLHALKLIDSFKKSRASGEQELRGGTAVRCGENKNTLQLHKGAEAEQKPSPETRSRAPVGLIGPTEMQEVHLVRPLGVRGSSACSRSPTHLLLPQEEAGLFSTEVSIGCEIAATCWCHEAVQ